MGVRYAVGDLCKIQVNKLDCDGSPLSGPMNSLVLCCVSNFEATPITDDTDDRKGICTTIPGSSSIDGFDIEWNLGELLDADLLVMLGTHQYVYDATGNVVGSEPICGENNKRCGPGCRGDDPCPNQGVSMLAWSEAWCGDQLLPQMHVDAFPRLTFTVEGLTINRSYQQDFESSSVIVNARTRTNTGWGQGPGAIYPDPAGLTNCTAGYLTDVYPDYCDCEICDWAFDTSTVAVGG